MIPAQAATQNTRRPATCRSYSGLRARRCRMTNAIPAATATIARPATSAPSFGTAAKLMPRISAPTSSMDRMPPRLSTGSVASFTWAGTRRTARKRATTASGNVIRKTEPHQKCSSSRPENSGPSAAMAPPVPDQSAIDFVRAGPDHSAVISAKVVGNAIPADNPPPTRATNRTESLGAYAASRLNGMASMVPRTSMSFRPYRSPMAPSQRTEAASPSEYPTAIRFRVVCDESNAAPIDGRATFATARFRLATAATKMSVVRTSPAR